METPDVSRSESERLDGMSLVPHSSGRPLSGMPPALTLSQFHAEVRLPVVQAGRYSHVAQPAFFTLFLWKHMEHLANGLPAGFKEACMSGIWKSKLHQPSPTENFSSCTIGECSGSSWACPFSKKN